MEEGKELQDKNKISIKIMIILISIIVVALSITYYAWSKYGTSVESNTVSQVARWHFELKTGTQQGTGYTLLALTRKPGYTHVAEGKLAPGTEGVIPIEIDTTGTEVTMTYDIKISLTDCPKNIKFYLDEGKTKEILKTQETVEVEGTEVTADVLTISKYLSLDLVGEGENKHTEVDAVHEETIYWEWPYHTSEADDKQDTLDQGKTVMMSITATGTEVLEKPSLKVGDLTRENAAEYYGQKVEYNAGETGTIWRLFYVDFDEKYGDQAGTIYLKADYLPARSLPLQIDEYSSSSDTKIEEMNPKWAAARGNSSVTWNNNERAVAYLCDTSKWTSYITQDSKYSSYVKYAIGSPSLEMFVDSYNQSKLGDKKLGCAYTTTYSPGYKYIVNDTEPHGGRYTDEYTLISHQMYTSITYPRAIWWIASPSCSWGDGVAVCCVSVEEGRCFQRDGYHCLYGICPIVALNPGAPIKFSE